MIAVQSQCRFLALFPVENWNQNQFDELAPPEWIHAAKMTLRFRAPDAAVYIRQAASEPQPPADYLFAGNRGIAIGQLFNPSGQPVPFDAFASNLSESVEVASTLGTKILSKYWGRYVCIVRDPARRTIAVFRDPSGALPVYSIRCAGHWVFFSHLQDLAALRGISLNENWDYLRAALCYSVQMQTRETALQDVTELQPGEVFRLSGRGAHDVSLLWSPARIAENPIVCAWEEAAEEIRMTTTRCVAAWGNRHKSGIHMLSGGLDSAIVLSCLSDHARRFLCVNYYDPESRSADERPFARDAASMIGAQLREVSDGAAAANVEDVANLAPFPSPQVSSYFHSRFEHMLAREMGATAIFEGGGGDQIFFQNPLLLALADSIVDLGFGLRTLELAFSMARIHGYSVVRVLRTAFLEARRAPQSPRVGIGALPLPLVTRDTVRSVRVEHYLAHPWVDRLVRQPGKREQIRMMCVGHDYYDVLGLDEHPEKIRPLISQPIMELTLRLPTYVLAKGGIDRALARHAFKDLLPASILKRRSKGVINQTLQQIFRHHMQTIRTVLLNGVLVNSGLLDRAALEDIFSGRRTASGYEAGLIVADYLSFEGWFRSIARLRTLTSSVNSPYGPKNAFAANVSG